MYFLINALKWFANPVVRNIHFDMSSLAARAVPLQVLQLPRLVSRLLSRLMSRLMSKMPEPYKMNQKINLRG